MRFLLALASAVSHPHVYRVPEWGNATIIEIIWTALGSLGVLTAAFAAVLVARDRRFFDTDLVHDFSAKKRTAMMLVWRGAVRRELGRGLQNGLVLGVGIWAMTQPALTRPTVTTATGLIITGIFFVWIAITIYQSLSDYRTRHAVVDVLDGDNEAQ